MSTEAVNPSSKLTQYFPAYAQSNADILLHILSFLTEKERVIVSRVCTTWREKALKDLDVEAVKIKELLENGRLESLVNYPTTGLWFVIGGYDNFFVFRCDAFVDVFTKEGKKTIEGSHHILFENESLIIFKGKYLGEIIAFDKNKDTPLFTNSLLTLLQADLIRDKIWGTKVNGNSINFALDIVYLKFLSFEPFVFLTVFSESLLAKWEFKNNELHLLDYWVFENNDPLTTLPSPKIEFACVHDDYLYVSRRPAPNQRIGALYNVKEKRKIPDKDMPLTWSALNAKDTGLDDSFYIKNSNSHIFQITSKYCSGYSLDDASQNWSLSVNDSLNFLISPTNKWVFLQKFLPEGWEIMILSAEKGEILKTFIFEHDESYSMPTATLYRSKLFIGKNQRIVVIDIEKHEVLTDVTLKVEEEIAGLSYSGLKLYLCLNRGNNNFSVKCLEHDKTQIVPFSQEKQTSHYSSSKAKIAAIAFGIFAVLAAAGALAVYLRGSINLSIAIGLGITAVLGTSGSTAAGIYHLKHKEIR